MVKAHVGGSSSVQIRQTHVSGRENNPDYYQIEGRIFNIRSAVIHIASLMASSICGAGGGGRGVEIGGSRVVQGVAAVAEQGLSRGSRVGHSSGLVPTSGFALSRVASLRRRFALRTRTTPLFRTS